MIDPRRVAWREARPYVLAPLLAGLGMLAARRRAGWAGVFTAAGVALFFRDPERPLSPEPELVYAAADGVITQIEPEVHDPWLPGGAIRVTTFLSLHNVHVNRSPVAGRITLAEELPGGFAPAFLRRSQENRRRRIAIDGPQGRVVVAAIAGLVARTITPWTGKGDDVTPGQRLGIIHFGSRTDVLLPAGSAEVLVEVGQRVLAGHTALARYRSAAHERAGAPRVDESLAAVAS